jgi:hypothetical protein
MHLLPRDFFNMSPRHFSLMIRGHQEKKLDTYRQTRMLMFTMVRLMGDSKSAPKTPEALWPLPGDEISKPTDEEYREVFNRLTQWQK